MSRTVPLLLVLLACDPAGPPLPVTETGNPERVLAVAGYDPAPPTGGVDTIGSAWAGLGETKLILSEQYVGEHELEWETPELVTDLSAGPVDLKFRSPSLGYDRVEVRPRTGRDLPVGAPPELEDASFVVDGTRADGVPFRIVSAFEEIVALSHPFELADEQVDLALGTDQGLWLDGLDLAGAPVQPDGSVWIDARDPARLSVFEANLVRSFLLVEDLDADGLVGDDDPVLVPLPE